MADIVDMIAGVNGAMAVLNITYGGQQGTLPNPLAYDTVDAEVKRHATEALMTGIPGITAKDEVDLKDFVVDRFPAQDDLPNRLSLRPKAPFGG